MGDARVALGYGIENHRAVRDRFVAGNVDRATQSLGWADGDGLHALVGSECATATAEALLKGGRLVIREATRRDAKACFLFA
jgi:hypothetical protein